MLICVVYVLDGWLPCHIAISARFEVTSCKNRYLSRKSVPSSYRDVPIDLLSLFSSVARPLCLANLTTFTGISQSLDLALILAQSTTGGVHLPTRYVSSKLDEN